MKYILITFCFFLFNPLLMFGKVKLPHIISNNMILQQNANVRLWGNAIPGKKISVTPSWSDKVYWAFADKNGAWEIKIKTPRASFTEYSIEFNDGDVVKINHIQVGEVWLCVGQSNMGMPMEGWKGCPVEGYKEILSDSSLCVKNVRFCTMLGTPSATPKNDTECQWLQTSVHTFGKQSAISYYFAGMMSAKLKIPIGVIEAYQGGTRIESWMNEESLLKYTDEPVDSVEICKKYSNKVLRPLLWGNGIMHPTLNYTVKGILFYQGCANVGDSEHYAERLRILAEQWRKDFGGEKIPFYYVQIAPFFYGDALGDKGARLREQQFLALNLIPNSAIIGTNDCVYPYEFKQVHPCQKRKVAERLASVALKKNYGCKNIAIGAPEFKSLKIKGNTAYVKLKNINLMIDNQIPLLGFEVAGEDRKFFIADAVAVSDNIIKVTSDSVNKPVAIRYCFRNFMLGNVKNTVGLPLFPFRTDCW